MHTRDQHAIYKALHAKTDMGRVKAFIQEHGVAKWRQFVKAQGMNLAKDATSLGMTVGLGLNFIDLRAPAYMLDPVYTPILNSTPRWDKVNAGYGIQPTWKAVTQIDSTGTFPGVSEGNINAYSSFAEKNYSAPYVTLGTDDFVTYESISASEGYADTLSDAKMWELIRFRRLQERTYIGGSALNPGTGTPLQLGTTPTPAAALSALGNATVNLTNMPVGSYAAAYAVALTYRAVTSPANTITAGIVTQYGRVSADGSATDVINGGTAIVSAASPVAGPTVTGTKSVLFSVTPTAGAWGYAWFVQVNTTTTFTPAAASAKLTGITNGLSYFVYAGQTQGTQTAAYSGSGGYAGLSADNSTNALDMDGILTIASNSTYTTNLPTWSYPTTAGTTVLTGGVDLHGAGLTNGGMVGTVKEFDNILFAIQSTTLTSPTAIYISTDVVNCFRQAFMVGATGSPQINFFFANGARGEGGIDVNTHVANYFNAFALSGGEFIPIIHHPYLPTGTALFDCEDLGIAYSNSRMGETRGVFVRRDTYGIEFAQNTRKYPFGVFSEEVLAVKTPNILGFIKGIGSFGTANIF